MNDKEKQGLIQNYLVAADKVRQEGTQPFEEHQRAVQREQAIFEKVVQNMKETLLENGDVLKFRKC